jgi:hypothetical protein
MTTKASRDASHDATAASQNQQHMRARWEESPLTARLSLALVMTLPTLPDEGRGKPIKTRRCVGRILNPGCRDATCSVFLEKPNGCARENLLHSRLMERSLLLPQLDNVSRRPEDVRHRNGRL